MFLEIYELNSNHVLSTLKLDWQTASKIRKVKLDLFLDLHKLLMVKKGFFFINMNYTLNRKYNKYSSLFDICLTKWGKMKNINSIKKILEYYNETFQ